MKEKKVFLKNVIKAFGFKQNIVFLIFHNFIYISIQTAIISFIEVLIIA